MCSSDANPEYKLPQEGTTWSTIKVADVYPRIGLTTASLMTLLVLPLDLSLDP